MGGRACRPRNPAEKCTAGQSPRGCDMAVTGVPPKERRGSAGTSWFRLVQAGPPCTPRQRQGWKWRPICEDRVPAGGGETCMSRGPGSSSSCSMWPCVISGFRASFFFCRRNFPPHGPHAALVTVSTSSEERGDSVCTGLPNGSAETQAQECLMLIQ